MTDRTKVADTLRKAADLIEERGWNQGDYEDANGCLCMAGALSVAVGYKRGGSADEGVTSGWRFKRYLAAIQATGLDQVMGPWNDDPDRTAADVTTRLRESADRYLKGDTPKS